MSAPRPPLGPVALALSLKSWRAHKTMARDNVFALLGTVMEICSDEATTDAYELLIAAEHGQLVPATDLQRLQEAARLVLTASTERAWADAAAGLQSVLAGFDTKGGAP